jgi:hypothetical protein
VFLQDYLEAYNQHGTDLIHVFSGAGQHEMHIDRHGTDKEFLLLLRLHMRLFELQKGLGSLLTLREISSVAITSKVKGQPL